MSKAPSNYNAPRRQLLALAPCVLMAADLGLTATLAKANPDAELIRVCQRFAEAELAGWYAYIVTNDREVEASYEDAAPDWATLRWIEALPAHTPAGYRAKALAFVAWHRDAYDDPADDRDGHSALLASLMRDLAAPARTGIIARLAKQYGPLPEGYTADGVWVGRIAA